jgi:hypothetical protein
MDDFIYDLPLYDLLGVYLDGSGDVTGELVSVNGVRGVSRNGASLNADPGTYTIVLKDRAPLSWRETSFDIQAQQVLRIKALWDDRIVQFTGEVDHVSLDRGEDKRGKYKLLTITAIDLVKRATGTNSTTGVKKADGTTPDEMISVPLFPENIEDGFGPGKEPWPDRVVRVLAHADNGQGNTQSAGRDLILADQRIDANGKPIAVTYQMALKTVYAL